jgi:parallel beta-helix repeat protein
MFASISNRFNTFLLLLLVLMAASIIAILATRSSAGPLDPPGAPAPTMKTLQQVEPRTPISSLPFTISQPGSYYVTGNLSVSSAIDGITVQADDVTIDLNGFELNGNGVGTNAVTEGAASPTRLNWRVYNGSVVGWGDALFGVDVSNGQIDHISASGIRGTGLYLGAGARVSDCSVAGSNTLFVGIETGSESSVESCSTRGFNTGISVSSQSTVAACNVTGAVYGVQLIGSTIKSCRIAATEYGILAWQGQSVILGNEIDMTSAIYPASCGIYSAAGGTAIDGNRLTNSPKGVCLVGSSGVTATRNSFYNMTTGTFSGYGGNDVPGLVAAASATNPLANICLTPPGTCAATP